MGSGNFRSAKLGRFFLALFLPERAPVDSFVRAGRLFTVGFSPLPPDSLFAEYHISMITALRAKSMFFLAFIGFYPSYF